ncbi:MAG: hypothetical protein AAF561_10440 [Planctomycetota bacterium]
MLYIRNTVAITGLAVLMTCSLGCGGESDGADVSGSQSGGNVAGPAAQAGSWIDVGDGIEVAILSAKVASEPGGLMLDDDQRPVAVEVAIVNTGGSFASVAEKPIKLLVGGEQLGIGMDSTGASLAFEDEALSPLALVDRLPPGMMIRGWSYFAPVMEADSEIAVLVGNAGNMMRPLADDQIVAKVALAAGQSSDLPDTPATPQPTLQLGETLSGGAIDLTVHSVEKVENARALEDNQVAYVVDVSLKNLKDEPANVSNATVASYLMLISVDGKASDLGMIGMSAPDLAEGGGMTKMATWDSPLEPGAETRGKTLLVIPDGHGKLFLLANTALGYHFSRDMAKIGNAPVGLYAIE